MKPEVSIIIPLYNYENYIQDCIKSCLKQTFKNFEVIIIDDKSTDSSIEKVKQIKDERVKLICLEKNSGYSHAKNEGIIISQGKYIVHLDADDMLTPDSLKIRLNCFKKDKKLKMVHGKALEFWGDKGYKWCLNNKKKMKKGHAKIHAQGVMLLRENYEKYGLYDEKMRSKADKEMWIRLRDTVDIKIRSIGDVVAFYRKHKKSMLFYRVHHKSHNKKIIALYEERVKTRKKEGINKNNTRFI